MPHIDWLRLPRSLREHMYDRLRTREITEDDMVELMNWISTNPEVPDGAWCKDFGTFKLVGRGAAPGTLLARDQPCFGARI
jgi:hypothetical protein